MQAPRGATALLSARLRLDGVTVLKFAMQEGPPKTVLTIGDKYMSAGPSLVDKMWLMLDEVMAEIKSDPANTSSNTKFHKFRARGIAECLALFMQPHFTNADEIAREAIRRYENRDNPEYETTGLGSLRFVPPQGFDKYSVGDEPGESKPAKKKSAKSKQIMLSDHEKEAIRKAVGSGMFTEKQLASAYKVSESAIKQIVAG